MPRPVSRFRNFIGRPRTVKRLVLQLEGAKSLAQSFPHTLLIGPSGVGKTLLGESLAAEYDSDTPLIRILGDVAYDELWNRLKSLKTNQFLFIDEAHKLLSKCQELLYTAIDDCEIPRLTQQSTTGAAAEESPFLTINSWTLVLATDQPNRLLNALHKRMVIPEVLRHYNQREMQEIVDHLAAERRLLLSPQARNQLAKVSFGLPRKAKQYLENLQRRYPSSDISTITLTQLRRFLREFDIDARGLGKLERQYLRILARDGKASLDTLASLLGTDDLRQDSESVLLRLRLITIGPAGRRLTEKGKKWIEKHPLKKKRSKT